MNFRGGTLLIVIAKLKNVCLLSMVLLSSLLYSIQFSYNVVLTNQQLPHITRDIGNVFNSNPLKVFLSNGHLYYSSSLYGNFEDKKISNSPKYAIFDINSKTHTVLGSTSSTIYLIICRKKELYFAEVPINDLLNITKPIRDKSNLGGLKSFCLAEEKDSTIEVMFYAGTFQAFQRFKMTVYIKEDNINNNILVPPVNNTHSNNAIQKEKKASRIDHFINNFDAASMHQEIIFEMMRDKLFPKKKPQYNIVMPTVSNSMNNQKQNNQQPQVVIDVPKRKNIPRPKKKKSTKKRRKRKVTIKKEVLDEEYEPDLKQNPKTIQKRRYNLRKRKKIKKEPDQNNNSN